MLWLAVAGNCAVLYVTGRSARSVGAAARPAPRWRTAVMVVLAVLALVGAVGGTATVVLAGHSGAKSVWTR